MKHLSVAVAAAAILLATTACGGSPDTAAATDQQPADGGPTQQARPGGRDLPGANGEIAAIDDRTMQVQNPMTGQVAVTYTNATTFSELVKATAADLEVGDCVMVSGEGDETVAATSVRIAPAVDGSCTPAGRRGGPGGPELDAGERPPGAPSDLPSGAPGRVMMGAFGKVSAVSDLGFTVESTMPGQTDTTTRQVTTTSATTWTTTVTATSSALRIGRCVATQGTKDETGAVTARTIAVSDKVDGSCGLQRFRGAQS